MKRYCQSLIEKDLSKKMVFIGGPRQVGKTTLAHAICKQYAQSKYFNWDTDEDRQAILHHHWLHETKLVVFDEIHKYPRWKQWVKGVYDSKPPEQQYLITGSARLDVYRKGGDSLLGRYHYWRLHPFTLDELPPGMSAEEGFERLLEFGGFPEPFLSGDPREARRWRRDRFERIFREDIRDLENIRHIQLLQYFAEALRERCGQLITLSNVARDLQISPKTVKHWLALIESMYVAFSITPLTKNIPRSIQKPPKVYFYDIADACNEKGARLENLVATHLLKRLHFIEDYYGYRCSLHYIRDRDNREVDFATVVDGTVQELIEVKYSDKKVSSSLKYYAQKIQPKRAIQLVAHLNHSYDEGDIHVTTPIEYFKNPPWEGV